MPYRNIKETRGFTILECVMALIVGSLIITAAFTISSYYAPGVTDATRRSFMSNDVHYAVGLFEARFRYEEIKNPAYTLQNFQDHIEKKDKNANEFKDIAVLWKKNGTPAFTTAFCSLDLTKTDPLVCSGAYSKTSTVALQITITPEEYPEMALTTYVARTRP